MKRIIAILALICLLGSMFPVQVAYTQETESSASEEGMREVLVVWRNANRVRLESMREDFRRRAALLAGRENAVSALTMEPAYGNSFARIRVPAGIPLASFMSKLRASGEVAFVEENTPIRALTLPNDEYFGTHQWNLKLINMPAAWETGTGEGVTVAVIDSGIAYENYGGFRLAPDFAGTSFTEGYDFVGRDTHPNDEYGHGTHVAGILAATMNNSLGIAGAAPAATLMPLKVLNRKGAGTVAELAEAVRWAADHGAQIVNMSVGSAETSEVLREALAYAYAQGVVLISATGNDGKEGLLYPASYTDYVIAVGAADARGQKTWYSNTGTGIDLVAPGGNIKEDISGDGFPDGVLSFTFAKRGIVNDYQKFVYTFAQGTSVAVPHVTGVVALMMAKGVRDPARIRALLRQSAVDLGTPGYDTATGAGLLNAEKALALAEGSPQGQQVTTESSTITRTTPVSDTSQNQPSDSQPANTENQAPDAPLQDTTNIPAPAPVTPILSSLSTELSFLNVFGRSVISFVWWEAPRVRVMVIDQIGKPVAQANVEIRYRYAGGADLGSKQGVTQTNGIAEFTIGPFARRQTIEVGVVAHKESIFSPLRVSTFTTR
jgi:serine protease